MATDTTKTEKAEDTGVEPEAEQAETTGKKDKPEETDKAVGEQKSASDAESGTEAAEEPVAAGDEDEPEDAVPAGYEEAGVEVAAPRRGGVLAGGTAVVSAALGLVSLTGNSLGEMLRERKQLIGQIESSSPTGGGGGGDQIKSLYGAPWEAVSVINGLFAFLAVAIGAILLFAVAKRAGTRSWVKALALGGVILGLVGLVVAGGMYFEILAPAPEMPAMPSAPAP